MRLKLTPPIRQRRLTKLPTTVKKRRTSNPKQVYECYGGPYDGKKIWLSKENPCTAEFSVRGCERGKYVAQSKTTVQWVVT